MTSDASTWDNGKLITEYQRYKRDEWPREKTRRTRRFQLGRVAKDLPSLITASEDDLLRWRDRLRGSAETTAQYVSVISGLYYWMVVIRKLRDDNPAQVLKRPKVPVRLPRPMLPRHYELALACALSEPELYIWLGLMGCSGLRCCEIAWAKTHEVEERDDGGGIARIEGKGGKVRAIPIGQMLMLTMRPFLLGRGSLFTRPDGHPWKPDQVSKRVNNFLRGIGLSETAHTMRHRFGTDYHALDADLFRQAKVMGHASVHTTQLYTEVDPIEAARYVESLTVRRLKLHRQPGWIQSEEVRGRSA
ncbi:site-specific integrase [Actinocrispum wychmicini]|nr:tyrosine-type recombinase/integrase [Actinocrispum wychmicini]